MAVLEWAEERTDCPIKPETLIWLLLLDSVRVDRRHSPPCQSTPPRSSFSFPLLSSTFPLRGCLLLKGAPWLHSESMTRSIMNLEGLEMIAVLVMIVLFVKALEQFGLIDSGFEGKGHGS
ncbi:hypothetical protein L345_03786, partial [Ophiophagus hannah]